MNFNFVHGFFHEDFRSVAEFLEKQIRQDGRGGAAVCIYHKGEKVVDIWAGERSANHLPWEADTLSISFSTTKGVISTALHVLADRGMCQYDEPVAKYWPEFGCNGKSAITIRDLLCHKTGLYPIRSLVTNIEQILDWDFMVSQLEKSTPKIRPGGRPGYQAITYGWLVGELIQRISGQSLTDFVHGAIVSPLDLDGLYLLTPSDQRGRIAQLLPPERHKDRPRTRTSTRKVRSWLPSTMMDALVPRGIRRMLYSDHLLDAPIPSFNGVFTARSLAKMYGALANKGEVDGHQLLSPETIRQATRIQSQKLDRVLLLPMGWSLGYHRVVTTKGILKNGFGHFGYGGSGAWADPKRNLAVAMTLNRIAGSPVGDRRMVQLGGAAIRGLNRFNQQQIRLPEYPEVPTS